MADQINIFFSYAEIDNRTVGDTEPPITRIINEVKLKLHTHFGKQVVVETSGNLGDNRQGSEQIQAARVCVAFVSPTYVNDGNRQADVLAMAARVKGGLPAILINYRPLLTKRPEALNMKGFEQVEFFCEPKTVAVAPNLIDPFSPNRTRKAYGEAIASIVKRLAAALGLQEKVSEFDRDKFKVLLLFNDGESHLNEFRDRLERRFGGRDAERVQFIHRSGLPDDVQNGHSPSLVKALGAVDLVVQAFGDKPGEQPDWKREGMVRWMFDQTVAHSVAPDGNRVLRMYLAGNDNRAEANYVDYHLWLHSITPPQKFNEQPAYEQAIEDRIQEIVHETRELTIKNRSAMAVLPGKSTPEEVECLASKLNRDFDPIRLPHHGPQQKEDRLRGALNKMFSRSEALLFLTKDIDEDEIDQWDLELTVFTNYVAEHIGRLNIPSAVTCRHGIENGAMRRPFVGVYTHIKFVDCADNCLQNPECATHVRGLVMEGLEASRKRLEEISRSVR